MAHRPRTDTSRFESISPYRGSHKPEINERGETFKITLSIDQDPDLRHYRWDKPIEDVTVRIERSHGVEEYKMSHHEFAMLNAMYGRAKCS